MNSQVMNSPVMNSPVMNIPVMNSPVRTFYDKQPTIQGQLEILSMIENARLDNEERERERERWRLLEDAAKAEEEERVNANLDAQFAEQMERQKYWSNDYKKRVDKIDELGNKKTLAAQSKTLDAARPFIMNNRDVLELIHHKTNRNSRSKLSSPKKELNQSTDSSNMMKSPPRGKMASRSRSRTHSQSPPRVTTGGGRTRSNRVRRSSNRATRRGVRSRSRRGARKQK